MLVRNYLAWFGTNIVNLIRVNVEPIWCTRIMELLLNFKISEIHTSYLGSIKSEIAQDPRTFRDPRGVTLHCLMSNCLKYQYLFRF